MGPSEPNSGRVLAFWHCGHKHANFNFHTKFTSRSSRHKHAERNSQLGKRPILEPCSADLSTSDEQNGSGVHQATLPASPDYDRPEYLIAISRAPTRNEPSETNKNEGNYWNRYQGGIKSLIPRSSCSSSSCRQSGRLWLRAGPGGAQQVGSMTPPCPTRSQRGREGRVHHQTGKILSAPILAKWLYMIETYPLLVCLVDGIEGILDCYTLEVSGCYFLP